MPILLTKKQQHKNKLYFEKDFFAPSKNEPSAMFVIGTYRRHKICIEIRS